MKLIKLIFIVAIQLLMNAFAADFVLLKIDSVAYTSGMTVDLTKVSTITGSSPVSGNVQLDLLDANQKVIISSFISRNFFSAGTIEMSATGISGYSTGLRGLDAAFPNGNYLIRSKIVDCSQMNMVTFSCPETTQTFAVTQYRSGFGPTTTQRPAYIDNQDGTVTDPTTGLIWMRCAMGQTWDGATCTGTASTYTFNQAYALTGNVTFAGQSDWRLTNIRELQTIVDRTKFNPAIDNSAFPNSPVNNFWTVTTDLRFPSMLAWAVGFGFGNAEAYATNSTYSVRLVRSGISLSLTGIKRPSSDYVDHGNGTVTHMPTKLMWKRCAEGRIWTGSTCSGTASFMSANQAKLLTGDFAGFSDWRLPTEDELLSLIDYSVSKPAINTEMFPAAEDYYFFSDSSYAGDSSNVWYVSFLTGNTGDVARSNYQSVRLVRNAKFNSTLNLPLVLKQNWNLLGNSLKDQPIAVASVFNDPAKVNTVWKWNAAIGGWQFYAPSMDAASLQAYVASKGYGLLSVINPGEGYWVNAKAASSLASQTGAAFNLTAEKLVKGWNLVATGNDVTPAAFNLSLSATPPTTGTVPLNLTTLWAWDNAASQWYFYAPQLDASGGLASYITGKGYLDFTKNSKTLGKGQGFWVNKP